MQKTALFGTSQKLPRGFKKYEIGIIRFPNLSSITYFVFKIGRQSDQKVMIQKVSSPRKVPNYNMEIIKEL